MGPDLTFARKQGRVVGEKLLAQLIKEHKLWDVTAPQYEGTGLPVLPGSKKRWVGASKKFIRAVEELFVEDACNGF